MDKVKTTLLLDKTLKKFAQVYAIQKETTLQAVVEEALRKLLVGDDGQLPSEKDKEGKPEDNVNGSNNNAGEGFGLGSIKPDDSGKNNGMSIYGSSRNWGED